MAAIKSSTETTTTTIVTGTAIPRMMRKTFTEGSVIKEFKFTKDADGNDAWFPGKFGPGSEYIIVVCEDGCEFLLSYRMYLYFCEYENHKDGSPNKDYVGPLNVGDKVSLTKERIDENHVRTCIKRLS